MATPQSWKDLGSISKDRYIRLVGMPYPTLLGLALAPEDVVKIKVKTKGEKKRKIKHPWKNTVPICTSTALMIHSTVIENVMQLQNTKSTHHCNVGSSYIQLVSYLQV